MQRLRQVRQTALAFYTYPSSVHTRFEHSLGVTVLAQRMLDALRQRKPSTASDVACMEVRLAALLHDVGHGPFSHASEKVYSSLDQIKRAKEENPLLKDNEAHEILSYFVIKSSKFNELWSTILAKYQLGDNPINLGEIRLDHVAEMILGHHPTPQLKYLAQIVNGPHDADKLDYITRDGYFTGLRTAIDLDRLFLCLGVYESDSGECQLCVDLSGVTALEQMLFNKMQLYTSVYHHHKVRAAFRSCVAIIDACRNKKLKAIGGSELGSPVDFMRIDDGAILSARSTGDADLDKCLANLRNRILPMRALVLCSDSVDDNASRFLLARMRRDTSTANALREEIATRAKVDNSHILVDFPEEPRFMSTALGSLVRVSPQDVVRLNSIFPVGGWVRGHAEHRYRVYVFSPYESEKEVAKAAYAILREKYGIKPNKMAFFLANHTPTFVDLFSTGEFVRSQAVPVRWYYIRRLSPSACPLSLSRSTWTELLVPAYTAIICEA